MKIFKYDKNPYESSLFFLNICVYNYCKKLARLFILNGIIKFYKEYDYENLIKTTHFKLFDRTIYKIHENGQTSTQYIFNIPVKTESSIKYYEKELKNIDKKYDDIYILYGHAGEIYTFLTYFFNSYKEQKQSKSPFFITTIKYQNEIIKMICPDIPCKYIKRKPWIKEDTFYIKNQRFFQIFDPEFLYKTVSENINSQNCIPYFNLMQKKLKTSNEINSINKIKISDENEKSMLKKSKKTGLNIDNFVFIAPEAKSCSLITKTFWNVIIKYYKSQNTDIFLNLNNKMVKKFDKDCKSINLTFPEAFALAKRAKKIITLRSGLSEILMQTNVKHDVIYTEIIHYKQCKISEHYPFFNTDNINDYLITENTKKEEVIKIYEKILS